MPIIIENKTFHHYVILLNVNFNYLSLCIEVDYVCASV